MDRRTNIACKNLLHKIWRMNIILIFRRYGIHHEIVAEIRNYVERVIETINKTCLSMVFTFSITNGYRVIRVYPTIQYFMPEE